MSNYSISKDTAAKIEQVKAQGHELTIDTNGKLVLCSIWSQTYPDGSSDELAKHHSTSTESAIKGAFTKWKKRNQKRR